MNLENFKSILLTNLVIISIFLTWTLWTYQPNLEVLPEGQYIQNSTSTQRNSVSKVIEPYQIVYGTKGSNTVSEKISDINLVDDMITKGVIDDMEDISNRVNEGNFQSYLVGDGKIQIIYPINLPMDILKKIYNISDRGFNDLEIDRIVIDTEKAKDNTVPIHFISYSQKKVIQANLNKISKQSFDTVCLEVLSKLPEYFSYKISDKAVFLPKKAVTDVEKQYAFVDALQTQKFKDALFRDPEYVKSSTNKEVDTYTDGTRLLQINRQKQMLSYVNPSIIQTDKLTEGALIQRSIDFIDGHNGWTDNYLLSNWDSKSGETTFRLFVNSHPVFSDMTLKQRFGKEEIISYNRPAYSLRFIPNTNKPQVLLPDGYEVIESLKKAAPSIDMGLVKDIRVGYELNSKEDRDNKKLFTDKYIELDPIWYIQYGEGYKKLVGGEWIGLE